MRVKMQVSIASSTWSYQPGQVVDIDDEKARTWIKNGHAERVAPGTPLTNREMNLRDLDAEEALNHSCIHCGRRAARVLDNKPLCGAHYRAMLEAGT